MRIEAVVHCRTQDLVRDVASDLLRRSCPELRRVDRAELWSFEVEGLEPARWVREVLERTTLIVNPNVHRFSLDPWETPPAEGVRVFVRVRDRVDARGAAVLRAIRERLGLADVAGVDRSVLWTIDLDTQDEAAASRVGCEVTGAGDRGAGLLANPHAQDAQVTVVPARHPGGGPAHGRGGGH